MKNEKFFLLVILILTSSLILHAQGNNQSFGVSINTDIPVAGRPWTLTFIIDYPDPDDISVVMPSLKQTGAKDGEITLDRIMRSTKYDNENIQTVIEYRFNVIKSGSINLEKFIISCPYGIVETNPLLLQVQAAPEVQIQKTESPLVFRLVWEINPPQTGTVWQMEKGQRAVLSLRYHPANPRSSQDTPNPPPGIFLPEVPPGTIISLSDPAQDDQIAANIIFIPAEAGVFSFAAGTVYSGNTRYQIPALRINVKESGRNLIFDNSQEIKIQEEGTPALDYFNRQENIDRFNARRDLPRTLVFSLLISGFFIVIVTFIVIYFILRKGTK